MGGAKLGVRSLLNKLNSFSFPFLQLMAKGGIVRSGTHVVPVEQEDSEYFCNSAFLPPDTFTKIPGIVSNKGRLSPSNPKNQKLREESFNVLFSTLYQIFLFFSFSVFCSYYLKH